jgi:predicted nicotinamide N-methyase
MSEQDRKVLPRSASYVMSETPDEHVGPTVVEEVVLAGKTLRYVRPKSPEQLLDLESVAQAYDEDQYMPYWAALWPVSYYLGETILARTWPPGIKAIELGCGLAVAGLAGLLAGMDVTFTDYDETALRFVQLSCAANGLPKARTIALDWRCPLDEQFNVILASDVVYEERSIEPIVQLIQAMLAPGGVVLLADQDRVHINQFLATLTGSGFSYERKAIRATSAPDRPVTGSVYLIRRKEETSP